MRSSEPDPLGADVVHVREDRCDGADVTGRPGFPEGRIKILAENLIHAIVGGEDSDCRLVELRVNLVLARGHGSLLPDLWYVRIARGSGRLFLTRRFGLLLPETKTPA